MRFSMFDTKSIYDDEKKFRVECTIPQSHCKPFITTYPINVYGALCAIKLAIFAGYDDNGEEVYKVCLPKKIFILEPDNFSIIGYNKPLLITKLKFFFFSLISKYIY